MSGATRPRALLVRAEGDVFSAGVDVNVFAGLDADARRRAHDPLLALTHRVEALPLPTLAVAHGMCLTAGLELSARLRPVVGRARVFSSGWSRRCVGITPLMGGTQRMSRARRQRRVRASS